MEHLHTESAVWSRNQGSYLALIVANGCVCVCVTVETYIMVLNGVHKINIMSLCVMYYTLCETALFMDSKHD